MNRIRILADQVANQIAAGEVIERPSSVLKELVENAIDAQATRIEIDLRGGGKSMIRVTDNGHGMGRDDALLCLERHATSKIRDSADIGAIHTLGFRGEAIPSIASVSRFKLLTREEESPVGTEIEINGGKLLSVKEAGGPVGAQVEVRNLFYNLPARRKFLRSDATELGHLHHVFLLHALAQPSTAWVLRQEERVVHELAPAAKKENSNEDSALLSRVRSLYGPQLSAQLAPVQFSREGISLRGLTGKAGLSRSNRSELHCFVNGRPVDSRAIYYGLIEGYHNALMRGRYPVCFLFLEIDPSRVDVNIHPAKREVRFREDALVQGTVNEAIRQSLGREQGTGSREQMGSMGLSSVQPLEMRIPSLIQPCQPSSVPEPGTPSPIPPSALRTPHSPLPTPHSTLPTPCSEQVERANPIPSPSAYSLQPAASKDSQLRILGVFARLYVIAADSHGILIVDQHAAHERILYEQMMANLAQGPIPSQKLLLPQTVELPPREAAALRGQISLLEKMGFGIAEFGDRSFILDALPPWVRSDSGSQLVRALLDELQEGGNQINRERLAEETVAKTVCRHAVKANDVLREEELKRMLEDLKACANPLTCPHGRPTMLRLTQAELERKFGRRPMGEP